MSMWHPNMTAEERRDLQEYNRRRYLPRQLEAARRKVAALEREALRYGMDELVNISWNDTIREAQIDAAIRGGSIGFRGQE